MDKLHISNIISILLVLAIIVLFVFASPFTLGEYKDIADGYVIKSKPVGALERSLLMLAVMMVPGALCYGLGLQVKSQWAKILVSPWFTWPIMCIGIVGALYLK